MDVAGASSGERQLGRQITRMVRPSSEVFLEDALDRRSVNRGEGHSELKMFWFARECKSAYVPIASTSRVDAIGEEPLGIARPQGAT
jgi:hypothetical protein